MDVAMHSYVYASQRKADTYLWLAERDRFDLLPPSLALMLGELRFVLEVELSGDRRLPHEDAQQVIEHLRIQGWHLQLPPHSTLAAASHPPHGSLLADRREDEDE
jgi:uncharacterized protein YcgL (UPF0745 family)